MTATPSPASQREGPESRVVLAGVDRIVAFLEKNWDWPGRVLAGSGKGRLRVLMADAASTMGLGTHLLERRSDSIVVLGFPSRRQRLAYRLTRAGIDRTVVEPAGVLLTPAKIGIPLILALCCVLPVVFTPLFYGLVRRSTERLSTIHLNSFCVLLETELTAGSTGKGAS